MSGLSGDQPGGFGVVGDPGEGLAPDDAQQGPVAGVAGGGDAVQPVVGMAGALGEGVNLIDDEGKQVNLRGWGQLDAVRREGSEVLRDPGVRPALALREGHYAVVAGGGDVPLERKN